MELWQEVITQETAPYIFAYAFCDSVFFLVTFVHLGVHACDTVTDGSREDEGNEAGRDPPATGLIVAQIKSGTCVTILTYKQETKDSVMLQILLKKKTKIQ